MDSEGNDVMPPVSTEHAEPEFQDDRGSNNSGSHSSDEFVKVNQDDATIAEDTSAADKHSDELAPTPAVSEITSSGGIGDSLLDRLDPRVIDLIYWRDIKKSAFVFSFLMLMLCSLTVFSVIAVISYAGLALLTVTVAFRLYKLVLQTLNGTQQPHPFQELLDMDVTLSPEQVHKYTDATLSHVNCFLTCARSLLLVQNTVSSIKLGVFLWLMTYIGCCFNGLTLLIVDVVLAFTLPPLYEKYQTQIDAYCKLAREKITVALAAAKAKMPGAKQKTQ